MKQMTPAQIRARLAEIKQAEEEHGSRDLDAELREVLTNGGDVDALEEQQVQAERITRRLRVEAQALKASLPDAERREAETAIAALTPRADAQESELRSLIDEMEPLVKRLAPLLARANELDVERISLHKEVCSIKSSRGLSESALKGFGQMRSARLNTLRGELEKAFHPHLQIDAPMALMKYITGSEYQRFSVNIDSKEAA